MDIQSLTSERIAALEKVVTELRDLDECTSDVSCRESQEQQKEHSLQMARQSLEKAKTHLLVQGAYARLLGKVFPDHQKTIEWTNVEEQDNLHGNFNSNDGSHKLHEAAKLNDIETINFCIKAGYQLDAEDHSGATPMLTAVIHGNYEAAKILRNAHVDTLVQELLGPISSPSRYYKHKVEILHTYVFARQMVNHKLDPARIGKTLANMNCRIDEVVRCGDPAVTKGYLQSYNNNEDIDPFATFPDDMLGFDIQHIQVLINYGPKSVARKKRFIRILFTQYRRYQKTAAGSDFLKRLCHSEIFDEKFIEILERYLHVFPRKLVKLIFKYDFQSVAKVKYGRDISRMFFGNSKRKVLWLLKSDEIQVDKRYHDGNTPLHIASKFFAVKNIEFLIAKGADPNSFNNERDTPLSLALKNNGYGHAGSEESIELLLLAGANPILIADQFEDTFFSFNPSTYISNYATHVIKLLVAHLAIYEAAGLSVEQLIKKFMAFDDPELMKYFEKFRQELVWLKIQNSSNNQNQDTCKMRFNLFTILAEKPENIVRCISEEQLQMITKLAMTYRKKSLNVYYRQLLRERIKSIIDLNRYRNIAIQIVCQFTGIHDANHLVVHKIISYFAVKDLVIFKDENQRK